MTTFAASVTIVDLPVGTTVTGAELLSPLAPPAAGVTDGWAFLAFVYEFVAPLLHANPEQNLLQHFTRHRFWNWLFSSDPIDAVIHCSIPRGIIS